MQKSCQSKKTEKPKNRKTEKLKIIFFGTPEFGAIVLEKLIGASYKPVLVLTAPDKPVGRRQILTPSPVKVLTEKHKIPVAQPERIMNYESGIMNLRPDLIIVAAYGKILPKEILEIPKYGCLNAHPSLLPKYRGPSPIQYTILNGDKETGVTIILMDEKMDHGPIISNDELRIMNYEYTYKELEKKLAELGADLLIKTIPTWIAGKIKPRQQDEARANYTKIIRKEDGKINWENPAEYIERQVRAFNPWPSAYTKLKIKNEKVKTTIKNLKLLKIYEAGIVSCDQKKKIGEVFLTEDKKIAVKTGQDCLVIEKLQLEGGKILNSKEFINGRPEIIGSILS